MAGVRVVHGDCREVLPTLPADSNDSCVTDPPYELAFMGKKWDASGVAFNPKTWAAVLRVLKPGAHLLAFGGTRTYHRMACAIEDAGFEIRDAIMWHYGSGFPKSHDVSKAIDRAAGAEREVLGKRTDGRYANGFSDQAKRALGECGHEYSPTGFSGEMGIITAPATPAARQWSGWGTALKPATEIILVARKPLSESTIAGNVLKHGTGAINVDGCRVPLDGDKRVGQTFNRGQRISEDGYGMNRNGSEPDVSYLKESGRWPANVIHDGSEEVLAGFPESDGQQYAVRGTERRRNELFGKMGDPHAFEPRNDAGSAARFFYTAKADKSDRLGSKHPTVKPIDLIAYLCRLVTPPNGTVLDPFAGSGTCAMACLREGFDALLIEREAEYVADIKRRIAHVSGEDAPLFAQVAAE